ncbi:DeoR/GlpR family DNA-binding transcription regulator [Glaciibacter flavus]|uniref:DeoR/GlpR family DNA-binding transcription regulator n=1 Tax=Orlajensenia flava TaxID=2565934 RepID=UPI003AFFB2E3
MTVSGSVANEDRREELRSELRTAGVIDLNASAVRWQVHPMTIRRDLDFLEQEGIARRVRGGAIYVGAEDFQQRQGRELAAKRRIAQKLLPLLPNKTAIGLDASTTVFQFVNSIARAEQISVITNGLPTFEALQNRPGIRAYLTGGESEEENHSLVGPLAVTAVSGFLLTRCFVSTTSIDPTMGTSEGTTAQVEVKRAMADASEHVVLAADSTKLGTRSLVRALPMSRIDLLVTELDASDPRLDPYRNLVEIL